jgi:hypothetical protein
MTNSANTFEIHNLDGRSWVRPHTGDQEFNGETFATMAEALAALPEMARDIGWSDYGYTVAE